MYINSYLFILISIDVFVLLGVLVYVYFLYEKERKAWSDHKAALHASEDIVEQAHLRATKVVSDAVEKAETTIKQGDYLRSDLMKSFEKSLQELSSTISVNMSNDEKDFEGDFAKFSESLRAEYLKKINVTLAAIETQAQHEVEVFGSAIQKDTIASQADLAKKIKEESDRALLEIQEYKKQQLKLVDESIEKVLQQVSSEVLSKSLSLEDHEQLIIDSLTKAKHEAFFEKGINVEAKKGEV